MRLKVLTAVSLLWLLAGNLAMAGELIQTIDFSVKSLEIKQSGGYHVVDLPGCPAMNDAGKPRLPHLIQSFSIPAGATVTGVEVVTQETSELAGSYDVIPAQREIPLPMPGREFKPEPVSPDGSVYARDAVYPASLVRMLGTGNMCGYRIGNVEIFPLRYNPAAKKLYFTARLTIKVTYAESQVDNSTPTNYQKKVFEQSVQAIVSNPGQVTYNAPKLRKAFGATKLAAGNFQYVIISLPPMDTVFQRLADWKTSKGVPAKVALMSDILADYSGDDDAEKVRNFIIDAKNTWGTVYVLLGGQGDDLNAGQNLIPARHAYYVTLGIGHYNDEDSIPSDLYYSDLDGDWDANGNNVYGELTDNVNLYPDVYVGRAPVLTIAQAQNFVAKTLNYEQNPPSGYVKKMLLPSAILWAEYEERPTQRAIAAMTPSGWLDDSLFERNGILSQASMVAAMNDGRGLGHWMGHGNENGIYMGVPYYSSSDADAAVNGDKQGICMSIACFTGAVDEVTGGDCLAEHIINRAGGGAAGVIMNSRYGLGGVVGGVPVMGPSEMLDTTFFHRLFFDGLYRQGQTLAAVKTTWAPYADFSNQYEFMRYCLYELNLFGDPELSIWTSEPESLAVTHSYTAPLGPSLFSVTVKDKISSAPIPGALVCTRYRNGSVYSTGLTDALGQVVLSINPTTFDTLLVTATARDHYPHFSYALTIPGGPYVAHLKHTMSDAVGNNDGIVNPGETVRLPVWVQNFGTGPVAAVIATLRTASPDGSVTSDSSYTYGDIAGGDSVYYAAGFGVYVNPADTNGMTIPLTLECRDALNSAWSSSFSLTVGTAALAYNSKVIGGNGRLDPNETAMLAVALKNNGLGYSYNTQASLLCSDGRVLVTNSPASFGTINPGAVGNSGVDSFALTIDPSIPAGTVVQFTLSMRADGVTERIYSWNETVGDLRYRPTPDNSISGPKYYAVEDSDEVCYRAPAYQWTEIRGLGTALPTLLADDATAAISLPFTFKWYGTSYTSLSACSNGWISFGSNASTSLLNTGIPAGVFAAPTIFPLWNDLYGIATGAWVGYYNDAANRRFIVEYDSIKHYATVTRLKFQVIFCESTAASPYYDVVIQYNLFSDHLGTNLHYSSVGFQKDGGIGGQLLFDNTYAPTMLTLGNGRAVRLTQFPTPLGVSAPPEAKAEAPRTYSLERAYPNPGRGMITIGYGVPSDGTVELAVYNVMGQKVRTLELGVKQPGYYRVTWDGRNDRNQAVGAGVYMYQLKTPFCTKTAKLTLLR